MPTQKKLDRKQEWNQAAMSLSFRAEELKSATETFAETAFLNVLRARANQVIYGRRGTGKTHLLKRMEEEYVSMFSANRVIPVFVNGSALRKDARAFVDAPRMAAFALYTELIKTITGKLFEFINSKIQPNFWDVFGAGTRSRISNRANKLAKELYDLVKKGEVRFLPDGEASQEVQSLNETARKISSEVELKLSDPRNLGWKIDLGASGQREVKDKGITIKKISGQIILPFTEVSNKVEELLSLLEGASLVVLFDEWSDVDANLETQPYLADMIKRTFSSIRNMHVKLACIPIRTHLATPVSPEKTVPMGYELGDDIKLAVDLDSVVFVENDLRQFIPFFMTLMKRHVGASLGWVASMDEPEFASFIRNDVFEREEVFAELCLASAGVPRDFIDLLSRSTQIHVNRGAARVQLVHVRDAAALLYQEEKASSFPPQSKEIIILDRIYRTIVAKNRSYFFLLTPEQSDNPHMRVLWAERLVHKMPVTHYDSDTHIRYSYYLMDFGKCVDLLKADAAAAGEKKARDWARGIRGYEAAGWLSTMVEKLGVPFLKFMNERQAVINAPASNLFANPKDIVVDESCFLFPASLQSQEPEKPATSKRTSRTANKPKSKT